MFLHHNDHRRVVTTLTTSRRISTIPHQLARVLRHRSLFGLSASDPLRPHPIAIDLDLTPGRHGAVMLHCPNAGISERRPLGTRHLSTSRITADTGDDEYARDTGGTPALALAIDLTPFVQPGPAIATRVTLSFQFVRESWWPRDLTDALADLANLWLQRLEEQAHTTALCHLTHRTRPDFYQPDPTAARTRPTHTSLSAASANSAHRQVFET